MQLHSVLFRKGKTPIPAEPIHRKVPPGKLTEPTAAFLSSAYSSGSALLAPSTDICIITTPLLSTGVAVSAGTTVSVATSVLMKVGADVTVASGIGTAVSVEAE